MATEPEVGRTLSVSHRTPRIVYSVQKPGEAPSELPGGANPAHIWVRKIPWRRKWQPTPVFLPRKSHGWGSLVGYSPWGRKESDMTEQLH